MIIQSLKRDGNNERGSALLHLLYVIINSGVNAPIALAYEFGHQSNKLQEYNAVRALMFRIQTSLCCVVSILEFSLFYVTFSTGIKILFVQGSGIADI